MLVANISTICDNYIDKMVENFKRKLTIDRRRVEVISAHYWHISFFFLHNFTKNYLTVKEDRFGDMPNKVLSPEMEDKASDVIFIQHDLATQHSVDATNVDETSYLSSRRCQLRTSELRLDADR